MESEYGVGRIVVQLVLYGLRVGSPPTPFMVYLPYTWLRRGRMDNWWAHAQGLVLELEQELARGLVQNELNRLNNRDCRDCSTVAQADTDKENSRDLGTYNKRLCKRDANQFLCLWMANWPGEGGEKVVLYF